MARKKKFVNTSDFPDYAIERFTRCIFDDVIAFFATEEGQAEYAAWEREQEELKKSKRAASKAALVLFSGLFSYVGHGASIRAVSPSRLRSMFLRNG